MACERFSALWRGYLRKEGTEVRPSVGGVVLYSGWFDDVVGNMIVVLGPKWKLHEYMHLKKSFVNFFLGGADSGP